MFVVASRGHKDNFKKLSLNLPVSKAVLRLTFASDFTCVYCTLAVAGTIFGTTDLYEYDFTYLLVSLIHLLLLLGKDSE